MCDSGFASLDYAVSINGVTSGAFISENEARQFYTRACESWGAWAARYSIKLWKVDGGNWGAAAVIAEQGK